MDVVPSPQLMVAPPRLATPFRFKSVYVATFWLIYTPAIDSNATGWAEAVVGMTTTSLE